MRSRASAQGRTVRRGSRRAWPVAVAAVAAVSVLAACSSNSSSSSTPPSGGGGGGGGSSSSAAKPLTIGIVELDSSTVAAQREVIAVQSAMTKIGWTVKTQDPQGSASQANSFCQQYVTQQVSAVVVDVFTGEQMAQCLTSAKSANIPVFFLASALVPGAAGALQTAIPGPVNQLFVSKVGKLPKLEILALEFSPGSPCLLRANTMLAELKQAGVATSQIQQHQVTVPGQVTDAEAATTAWLNAHPDSAGQSLAIWACFSDPALGALAALKQAGRKVPIYTWDLTQQVIAPVKSGQIVATSISDASGEGAEMISLINHFLSGGKAEELQAKALVLTASNIASYVANNKVSS